jgi:hypothetical protein
MVTAKDLEVSIPNWAQTLQTSSRSQKNLKVEDFFSDFCDSFVTDVDCSHESPMEPECAEGAVDVVGFISMLK